MKYSKITSLFHITILLLVSLFSCYGFGTEYKSNDDASLRVGVANQNPLQNPQASIPFFTEIYDDRDSLVFETGITSVEIDPHNQLVDVNSNFSINIILNPFEPFAGLQSSLTFDPLFLTCLSVIEGALFEEYNSYFNGGVIDNTNGTIKNVVGLAITGESNSAGIFAIINFTSKGREGISPLILNNVIVGNRNARPLPITMISGNVTISGYSNGDVNMDGKVNILDLILIGQYWGEMGSSGWTRADTNKDGIVNILDMITVGQHWTG